MKKRDRFWINRILLILAVLILFVVVSLYNIIQLNGSYIAEEKSEHDIFIRQIEWAITPILESQNFDKLKKYTDNFKNNKEFSFRIFDENKNLIISSTEDTTSELAADDVRLSKNKFNLWELYRQSFNNKSLESAEELTVNNKKYYLEVSVTGKYVLNSIINAQKNIIILFGICLILLFLFIVQIFFSLRNSFNTFEDSVVKISKGELDTKIKIPRNGLLEELALSIVQMTQRLKMQIHRLSQLEQYKADFIQNITHEIKTPITAINSAIELVEENNNISETDQECLDIIHFQTNAINKLVGDILALGEIDLQKTQEIKNFQDVNLSELIQEVIGYYEIGSSKINFIKDSDITIKANRELLATAISNLLSNAIRYSKSENIDIIVSNCKNKVIIEIKDYGIGIEKEHLPRIFERFYRVDKSRSRRKGGTGLGLSIVKNIVELHNWEIEVSSETGKGTSFKIII